MIILLRVHEKNVLQCARFILTCNKMLAKYLTGTKMFSPVNCVKVKLMITYMDYNYK